jgi:hypothetical protein
VKLVGDAEGIAVLKALVAEHRDYLKFLIAEAGTNSDHHAPFRAQDGTKYELVAHPESSELEVRKPKA